MKILVEADELHKIFMQAVKLKERLEENDTRREIAYYITKTLGSMWFQGTRAYAEDIEDSINQPIDSRPPTERLNDIMQELKEAALNWKPAPEGSISDINNEDREWADKEVEKHQATTIQSLELEIAHLRGQVSDLFGKVKDMQTKIDKPKLNLSQVYQREAISQELNNKYIIVEMLDMISAFANDVGKFTLGDRAYAFIALVNNAEILKNKLVGKI